MLAMNAMPANDGGNQQHQRQTRTITTVSK